MDAKKFQLLDDSGKVVMEGLITAWSWNLSVHSPTRTIEIEGIEYRAGNPNQFYMPNTPFKPAAVACAHEWKMYNGFTENYEYCDACGVKK